MKPNIYHAATAAMLTVPICLLLVGCEQKTTASIDSTPTSTNVIAADADNSGKNVRDRNDATVTPGDQSNAPADLETTQKIRKALVSGTNDFSLVSQNIKIITSGGKVTLRGPVKTAAEKDGIVNIARTVAGENNVVDQLEVKANP